MPTSSSSTQKSGMRAVWWMSWSRVTVEAQSGIPGTYAPMGSDRASVPSRCSMRMAVAVNCFEIEAMSKRVVVVTGMPASRSARPAAPAQATSPRIPTAAEQPG
jgi:hypothetical protein